jgi:hypothetical protein
MGYPFLDDNAPEKSTIYDVLFCFVGANEPTWPHQD